MRTMQVRGGGRRKKKEKADQVMCSGVCDLMNEGAVIICSFLFCVFDWFPPQFS